MSVVGVSIFDLEVLVGSRGDDPVHPGLLVLMSRSGESCSRQLFGIEAIRSLLGRVLAYGKGSFNGFRSARQLIPPITNSAV